VIATASGSLKVVDAAVRFAEEARAAVEATGRAVLDEAIEAGEKVPYALEAYVPRVTAERSVPTLRALFDRCFREGFHRAREEP
jgi:hypothetical protein